ncbi:uncharacterized protein LOC142320081 [Lycorma delicatula]|uniref:uncharacterized protein LOC142320081 n=1 Tax=Lycorma delicatula TaxID=130591 RepID=UPI003F51AA18
MEFSWIITAILGIIVIYCIKWFITINNDYWKKKGVRSVDSKGVFGMMLDVILLKRNMSDVLLDMYKQAEGEKFIGSFQFMTPTIVVRDPELINQVLIKDFTYFEDRGPPVKKSVELFSSSLGNLCGDEWRGARQKLTPTFTSGKLKMMFEPIKECCSEAVLYLKDNGDIEARGFLSRLIIKIIGNVAFGLKVDILDEEVAKNNGFFIASSKFLKPSLPVLLKFFISVSCPNIRNFFKLKLMDDDVNTFFRNLTKDIIKHRQETGTRRNDFLQIMLDQKKKEETNLHNGITNASYIDHETEEPEDKELFDQLKCIDSLSNNCTKPNEIFTEEFIASQTFLFISGGSETTAAILSFVLYELAMNPELQIKVQQEISDVLSSHEFNYAAVKKMTYMEQFIYETLRLHPLAGALIRYCTKDYKIPGSDIVINKGTVLNVPVVGLHRDPHYFPNPEKFNPDRFENMEAIPKGVYFPFGSGPRICIAMRLAMLEMKIILTSLFSHYTVELSKKTKLPLKMMKTSIFLNVEGGIWVKFTERKNEDNCLIEMLSSWIITAILGIILFYCIYWFVTINNTYWKKKGVLCLDSKSTFGVILDALLYRRSMSDLVLGIYKQLEEEKFGGFKQFLTPVITICDPELINQILIKDFTYFEDRGPKVEKSVEIFNSNLGNLCGDEWRVARHKLTPTFSSGKLKIMFEPIRECCSEAVLYLKDNKNDVEAKGFISRLIIKIIANAAFGLKVDILNEEKAKNNQFFITSSKFLKPSIYLFLKFFVFMSFPKVRNFLKFKLMDDDVDKFFKKLTKDITKQRQETGMRRNDFLQILLDQKKKEEINLQNQSTNVSNNDHEAEEPEDKEIFEQLKYMDNLSNDCSKPNEIFTEDFIASQAFMFISGGSETTATVLSFVLFELAMNPELQIKVQQEISDVLSSHDFNYDAVKKMKYLEQFIYETLRLHPLLSVITRYCTKDYKIPGTDVVIEKGTLLNVPVLGFHKDPQYFPNPEIFNPDHFKNMEEIPKGVYFPFGHGPRICIAMRLAMLEMKIILASLLSHYTVELSEKTKLPLKMFKISVFPVVDGGIWVKFKDRQIEI